MNYNSHAQRIIMNKGLLNFFILISVYMFLGTSCSPKISQENNIEISETGQKDVETPSIWPILSPKVEAIYTQMTIEEKIGQLNLLTPGGTVTGEVVSKDVNQKIKDGKVGGIFGIRGAEKVRKVQEIAIEESRLAIPLIIGMDVIHGHQTIFPIPLALSCSWDMDLVEKTARQAAREATADGIMWTFSPMVDVARDPRWGRIAEGAGEDPFLGSEISKAMVKGYQGSDLSDETTMIACVKHFANYGAAEGGRDYGTVDMSKQRSYNEYLPPYKAAVDAGVESVMTSFNVLDYVPASGNKELFTNILREQWNFDGFVVTDYTSINEMIQHGTGDLQQVSVDALKAGIDMDMVGEGFLTTLKKSLDEGLITEREINVACRRILRAKEKLGLFQDPYKYFNKERAETEILSSGNRDFAREVATKSFVLLKNEDKILPLQKKGTIAIIGPLADSRRNMLGTWAVSGDYKEAPTLVEGIIEATKDKAEIYYAKGSNITNNVEFAKRINAFGPEATIDERSPEEMIKEAVEIASKSDVIIAAMGETANMSGEASSLAYIGIQKEQRKLLEALKATGKPIVLVLFNGRPMTIEWESENMNAILDVWFGGTEGGRAIADVLFGDAIPEGKLTTSFPVHGGQIPVYHSMLNTGRPDNGSNSKFRSNYLDIKNEPLYPFGFGLSYSEVKYENVKLSATSLNSDSYIKASVQITNTGKYPVNEIVQLYIRDVEASISRPMKELKGFKKVPLQPNETKTVFFEIREDMLRFYNSKLKYGSESGQFELMIGKNSVEVETLNFILE